VSYLSNSVDGKIIELIKNGAVGFMPSDTIYGLSCSALNEEAVQRLRKLKGRGDSKRMIVLVSDISQFNSLNVDAKQTQAIKRYWPGHLTLICKAPDAPLWLNRGEGEFGIRQPGSKTLRNLIAQTGPLISTSANLEGGSAAQSQKEAHQIFGEKLDFYVDAGKIAGPPSTVVEEISGKLKIIRQGAVIINKEDLYAV
jgi:L-threonylcarbamoyladenylate synthase